MSTTTPSDFLLRSFNAFDENIALDPTQIVNNLNNYLRRPLTDKEINMQTMAQTFQSSFYESYSSNDTQSNFAASVGLKGKYGCFSASMSVSVSKTSYQSSTAYNCGFDAVLNSGACYFSQKDSNEHILNCLKEELSSDLKEIASIADAEAFTDKYGTHIVLGVKLGGAIYFSTTSETSSSSAKSTMAADVKAKYKSVGSSMSASASVSADIESENSASRTVVSLSTSGGDAILASKIDKTIPQTIHDWEETCNSNSVQFIDISKEFWDLAENGSPAQTFLKRYVELRVLIQSLSYPSIFSASIVPQAYVENTATVTLPENYRLISGGARTSGSNRLTSSFPNFDQSKQIVGWNAKSHDIGNPSTSSDVLTAYAIAVYDPTNLLNIECVSAQSPSTGSGGCGVSATLTIDQGYCLTGGGCQADVVGNSASKYIMESYPNGNAWNVVVSDYQVGSINVITTAYAIGISSADLRISSSVVDEKLENYQHGNATASVSRAIAGGGVKVQYTSGSMGNLVQSSFPASANSWEEYNGDMCGNACWADATVYAIQLTAKLLD